MSATKGKVVETPPLRVVPVCTKHDVDLFVNENYGLYDRNPFTGVYELDWSGIDCPAIKDEVDALIHLEDQARSHYSDDEAARYQEQLEDILTEDQESWRLVEVS